MATTTALCTRRACAGGRENTSGRVLTENFAGRVADYSSSSVDFHRQPRTAWSSRADTDRNPVEGSSPSTGRLDGDRPARSVSRMAARPDRNASSARTGHPREPPLFCRATDGRERSEQNRRTGLHAVPAAGTTEATMLAPAVANRPGRNAGRERVTDVFGIVGSAYTGARHLPAADVVSSRGASRAPRSRQLPGLGPPGVVAQTARHHQFRHAIAAAY
jgi:hypothetical protein